MKKYFIVILIILSLGVLSWAQGSKELFDGKKSEAELEIMKGILSTTISYVAQNSQKDALRLNVASVSAYYLVGQGAVFVIPTSGLRPMSIGGLSGQVLSWELPNQLAKLKEQAQSLEFQAERQAADIAKQTAQLYISGIGPGRGAGIGSGTGSGVGASVAGGGAGATAPYSPAPVAPPAPPVAPAPHVSPAPPAPPVPSQINREDLRKQVLEYQSMIKKNLEDAEANRGKLLESLKEIRVYLIEALANYGDSLTTVKPGEYINLILYTDTLDTDFGRMKTRHDVISAQKSWITDYKAGRLTLENFKQKVLQYTE